MCHDTQMVPYSLACMLSSACRASWCGEDDLSTCTFCSTKNTQKITCTSAALKSSGCFLHGSSCLLHPAEQMSHAWLLLIKTAVAAWRDGLCVMNLCRVSKLIWLVTSWHFSSSLAVLLEQQLDFSGYYKLSTKQGTCCILSTHLLPYYRIISMMTVAFQRHNICAACI